MYIRIEKSASTPVSRQIAEQIRAQIISGGLNAGTALPSVRQLARELAVNVNTVFRVYERLASEGLIEMRQGEGTFVLPRSGPSRELVEQRELHAREFETVIRRGLMLGLTTRDLRRMLTTMAAEAKLQIARGRCSEEK